MYRSLVAGLSAAILITSLASSPASAAVEAAVKHDHVAPATSVTLKELEKRPKTELKIAKTDTVIYVGDMHCAHCAKAVASKLYAVKGVVKVRTDVKADVAIISPQSKKKLDPLALWKAAKTAGFPAVKLEGPSGTYVSDAKTKNPKLLPKQAVAPKS